MMADVGRNLNLYRNMLGFGKDYYFSIFAYLRSLSNTYIIILSFSKANDLSFIARLNNRLPIYSYACKCLIIISIPFLLISIQSLYEIFDPLVLMIARIQIQYGYLKAHVGILPKMRRKVAAARIESTIGELDFSVVIADEPVLADLVPVDADLVPVNVVLVDVAQIELMVVVCCQYFFVL